MKNTNIVESPKSLEISIYPFQTEVITVTYDKENKSTCIESSLSREEIDYESYTGQDEEKEEIEGCIAYNGALDGIESFILSFFEAIFRTSNEAYTLEKISECVNEAIETSLQACGNNF